MSASPPSLAALLAELAAARRPWPVLHESSPSELGRQAAERRDRFQYSLKLHDWFTFFHSKVAPAPVRDSLDLPVPSLSPVQSPERLRTAIEWFMNPNNFSNVISAIDRWMKEHKSSEWLTSYFTHSTFPTLYNHFSTAETATAGLGFIRRVLEEVSCLNAVELSWVYLRCAFSFRQHIADRLFSFIHVQSPTNPGPTVAAFQTALCDSLEWLTPTQQELLRVIHGRKPVETNRMLVKSFFVEIANVMRMFPEFIANDVFATYTFLEEAKFTLEFPIHKSLSEMDDKACGKFCVPFWARLESNELPSGQFVDVSAILGDEADTVYFSELDLSILESLYNQSIAGRATFMKVESSYLLFELQLPSTASPPSDGDPTETELRRMQLHRAVRCSRIDPFRCLPDSNESRALFDLEISWYRESLESLFARVATCTQFDADIKTVNSLVSSLFLLHVERFPILLKTPNRLQSAVPEIRRRFAARLLALTRLDLVGIATEGQVRELAREFPDTSCSDRQSFVKNLVPRVAEIGKFSADGLLRRYHRMRETYDAFEVAGFLQTLSGIRVELEVGAATKRHFGTETGAPQPPEFARMRKMLVECLARRRKFAERETGAQRLRGHEAIAVGQIAAQIAGNGGQGALRAIVESFDAPQRQEIADCFQAVRAIMDKASEKFGVAFDAEFIANVHALVGWMDALGDE
jgi:hypothetical protein